ncbi:MAG: hypothetical protein KAT05_11000, partial [Spirochaetes bacterium]|nr:hypothetical protein [Spirochaetota bacterium]
NNDYNKALEALHTLKINSFSQKLKNKIFFLQSVCYFYKRNYNMALKLVQKVLDNDPVFKKASYLKSLILNRYGELK